MRTARLWTFSKNAYWPPASYNKNQLPAQTKLADAGFYYSPTLDSPVKVTCPYCLVSLTKMSKSTNLMAKHEELSPDCPYFQFTPSTRRSEKRTESSTSKDNNTTRYSGIKRKSSTSTSQSDESAVPVAKAPTRPRSSRLTGGQRSTRDDVSTKRSTSVTSTTRNVVTQNNRALSQPKTRSSDPTQPEEEMKNDVDSDNKRKSGSAGNNLKPSLDDSIWDIGKAYRKKEAARAHNPHTYSKKDQARNAPILPDTFRKFINESSQSRDPTPEPSIEDTSDSNSQSTRKTTFIEPETIQRRSTRNDNDVFVKPADVKRNMLRKESHESSSQPSPDNTTTNYTLLGYPNDRQHLLFRTSTPHAHSFWDDDNDDSALANMTFSPIRPRDFSVPSSLINTPRTTDTRILPSPITTTSTREDHETNLRERLRRREPPTSPTLSHAKSTPLEQEQKHVALSDEPSISDSTTGMTPEELDLSVDQFYMNLFQENAQPLQCLGEELASSLESQVNDMINVNDENDNSTSMND
ncbi:hypothetical protein K492DRAFT_240280 [Lichtheimia hyalospora FSU 10163]|nr:hypothetical protein K492DRAFT_240280 [Lichtheimia hyalospora FSU 10163]